MKPPRSTELLDHLNRAGLLPVLHVHREIGCSEAELATFLSGDRVMSPARQLALAELVLREVPAMRRMAAALRGQATAALAIEGRALDSTQVPPASWQRMRRAR